MQSLQLSRPRRQVTAVLAAVAVVVASAVLGAALAAAPAHAVSSGLVISAVYGGGGNTGAPYTNDYVELVNRGASAVSTAGMSVQYASANGTGNFGANSGQLTELPSLTVQPGQHVLLAESGGTTGAALPATDVTDPSPINLSGTAGKVALVTDITSLGCNGGSAPCSVDQVARIVDLVGYGTANFFEGTAPAGTTSNTTAANREGNGCVDTDDNSADFTVGTPSPRNTSSAATPCGTGDAAPTVASTTPADGATNVPLDSNVTVTFSEPVDVQDDGFAVSCSVSGPHDPTLSGGPTTYALDPLQDFSYGDTCTLTVTAAKVTDADSNDPPDTMTADYTSSFSVPATNPCDDPFTHTFAIQGSGAASPLSGQTVTTMGVVVADAQDGLSGFAIQDLAGDGNDATSDGLFVFGSQAPDVAVGDVVRVTGRVSEFRQQTEITYSGLTRCGTTSPVQPTVVHLPVATNGDLERYEGMLVTVADTLTVQQNYFLGRYGQLTLGAGGRLYQPTNLFPAGSPAAGDRADLNARSLIVLDDATSGQNPDPTPYLDVDDTRRAGDLVDGVTGMLDEGPINTSTTTDFWWRIQPTTTPDFTSRNPRTAAPEPVGGNIEVGFFNVLNYFTTLDDGSTPPDHLQPRGANTAAEFERQRTKIFAAMSKLDADVFGLSEIENPPGTHAVQNLVDGLNAYINANGGPATTYAAVPDPSTGTGDDAIKVAMIYKPAVVGLVGTSVSDTDPVNNRPPLAQEFRLLSNGETVNVVVNHLKSKGSCPPPTDIGDRDNGDGQGCWNALRVEQAQQLLHFIDTVKARSGDDDVLAIGDFNSYGHEDPIEALKSGGLLNEIEKHVGDTAYSYVFDGLSGYLDHGLATASADGQVVGATEWHINADEPSVIDYNTEFKDYGTETRYGPDYYEPTPYRSSDHDPVLLGVDLGRCQFADDDATRTRTLQGDCSTDHTVGVPDGWTLDGAGHTISAYDPPGGHFTGAVVANEGAVARVRDLTVTAYHLADVCDDGTARLRGILLDGATGSVVDSRVVELRQDGSGCQEGNAIEARSDGDRTSVTLTGNEVSGYQKTGILVNGAVDATVGRNDVHGLGPVGYIAQNGVQVSRGATAVVDGNVIADNFYTGPDIACGLLVYQADGVKQRRNTFVGNEQDLCNVGRGGGDVTTG